jgi:hypothetical protein
MGSGEFLSTLDGPGGVHGTGRIDYVTRFVSGSSDRCPFSECTVEWFYENGAGYYDVAVDWTRKTCTRFDGRVFVRTNPTPARLGR